jgi:hypothetical protein
MKQNLYVQYGCGFSAGEGWENFDSSLTLRIERIPFVGSALSARFSGNTNPFPVTVHYGDICRGLPIIDGTAHGCYASHVLEHLGLCEFRQAVRNTFRMLASGGVFRLIVPDLYERARRYVVECELKNSDAAHTFLRSALLGQERRPRTSLQHLRSLLGRSSHLWMWDEYSISAELKRAGFVNIRRCEFGDSTDPMFGRVEDRGRFFDEQNKITECAIEAHKPK